MATIRFTSAERPQLLARAVIAYGRDGIGDESALDALAAAFVAGEWARFDAELAEHFRPVALDAIGIVEAGASAKVGVTGEPPREAEVDAGVEAE